ncbi:MAG TPA: DoxX family protein [Candidatus Acidoferrales bacterium]|nr:DoxX family protein [Candidatus Acidoferrales bacterium]
MKTANATGLASPSWPAWLIARLISLCGRIPDSLIALIGRFSIAAVFWLSGQTKIEGLAINLVQGEFRLGWPHLSDSALSLFQEEYALPLIPPAWAATLAAVAEHVLPVLILIGLATRLSALGLLGMTLVIQVFVYPGAYPTHGVWATVLLYLIAKGPGRLSIDAWVATRYGRGG